MLSLISQLLKGERAGCYGKVIKFSQKRPVEEVSAQREINIRNGINETRGHSWVASGNSWTRGQSLWATTSLFSLPLLSACFCACFFSYFLQTGLCLLVSHGAK